MGSAASRARAVPDPTEAPGPVLDQNWDAFERLKHSCGALWTDEMASSVEHNLRHKWDLAPIPGEKRGMWDIRVDATYYYHYSGMVQWINEPLRAAQGPAQGQREHSPPNSEKPPEEREWHQLQKRSWDHHGGGPGYQNGGKGWSGPWAQEEAKGAQANAHGRAGQWNGNPWQQWGTQGPQDGPGNAGDPQPADPWAAYKKGQDGPLPAQQSG